MVENTHFCHYHTSAEGKPGRAAAHQQDLMLGEAEPQADAEPWAHLPQPI